MHGSTKSVGNRGRRNDTSAALIAIFDAAYYRRRHADVAAAGVDPLTHFLSIGWAEGRNPCALFDTELYFDRNPEVMQVGANPLLHYIEYGAREGRQPSLLFDANWYLAKNPDIAEAARANPLAHYLAIGAAQGREANPLFDQAWYLLQYPNALSQARSALEHYAERGFAERLSPHRLFDGAFYLHRYPDVARAEMNPLAHFLLRGHLEIRHPHELFDSEWYLASNADVAAALMNPLLHYVSEGEKEGRPTRPLSNKTGDWPEQGKIRSAFQSDLTFDPVYYLAQNPDIAKAKLDPLQHYLNHGRREGRAGLSYAASVERRLHRPLVSVIVPNFNHGKFLEQRLASIYGQTYQNIEVILLDDASSDDSVALLEKARTDHADKTRLLCNKQNSGSIFSQWRKGIAEARGDLLWICESDDFADAAFLDSIVPFFADPSIMIGFGRIQFADHGGQRDERLDAYREAAEPGLWHEPQVRCARDWFTNGFSVSNLIPNVGGCVIRKQDLHERVWTEASSFKILGDWYLYIQYAGGGRIAYSPNAIAYFRQHGANTSVRSFTTSEYYAEHEKIASLLRGRWQTPESSLRRLARNVEFQYRQFRAQDHIKPLKEYFDVERILQTHTKAPHVLIGLLSFSLGGGEIIPINIANNLVARGVLVSILNFDPRQDESGIRERVDKRIPVYESHLVRDLGVRAFIERAGIDVIHSHMVNVDLFFHAHREGNLDVPYLVTLHGSYECCDIPADAFDRIVSGVDHWVYTAEKNLKPLERALIDRATISHIPNGVPPDDRPFPNDRPSMGIAADDFVFALVSRPIKEKGWEQAILALHRAQQQTSRKLRLLLCGEGPELGDLRARYESDSVRFLGYQDRVVGLYKLADCALLPSRFKGESFPMSVIEALHAGTPVITTRVGHIPSIIHADGIEAGELIDPSEDDERFVDDLTRSMLSVASNETLREKYAAGAVILARKSSMDATTDQYCALYSRLTNRSFDLTRGSDGGSAHAIAQHWGRAE